MADERHQTLIERDEVAVMFKRVADERTAINRGRVEVEEAIGSLRGHKFYGAFDEARVTAETCASSGISPQGCDPRAVRNGRGLRRGRLLDQPEVAFERPVCQVAGQLGLPINVGRVLP